MWICSLLTGRVSGPSLYLEPSIHLRHYLPAISTVLFLVFFLFITHFLWCSNSGFRDPLLPGLVAWPTVLENSQILTLKQEACCGNIFWVLAWEKCSVRTYVYLDNWENHTLFCNIHTTLKKQSCLHFQNLIKHSDWNPHSLYQWF